MVRAQAKIPWGGLTVNRSDLDYYRARLLAEEAATRQATHPAAARCHRSMADHYARLLAAAAEEEEELVQASSTA